MKVKLGRIMDQNLCSGSNHIIGFITKIIKTEKLIAIEYKSQKYNFVWLLPELVFDAVL